MQKIAKLIIVLVAIILTTSCEDVIDLNLDNAAPRLVVDASIVWTKGTDGANQTIRLTTTAPFYNNSVPAANGAIVSVTSNNQVFQFVEDGNTGNYICQNFVPEIGETYFLNIIYNGVTYVATEKFIASPSISNVVQTEEGGFLGTDKEVRFLWQDNADEENFYLTSFNAQGWLTPDYSPQSDRFFNGNQMFSQYSDEDLTANTILDLRLSGISLQYYNYLIVLYGNASGGNPFQGPPATVRGNVVNPINTEDFALGYFSLSESDFQTYVVQ